MLLSHVAKYGIFNGLDRSLCVIGFSQIVRGKKMYAVILKKLFYYPVGELSAIIGTDGLRDSSFGENIAKASLTALPVLFFRGRRKVHSINGGYIFKVRVLTSPEKQDR